MLNCKEIMLLWELALRLIIVMLQVCHAFDVMWMGTKLEERLRVRLDGCNSFFYSIKYLNLFPICLSCYMMLICVKVSDSIYLYSTDLLLWSVLVFCWCLQVLIKRVKYGKERHDRYKGDKRKAKLQVGILIFFVLSIAYRKRLKCFKLLF